VAGLERRLLLVPRLQPWAALQRQARCVRVCACWPRSQPALRRVLPFAGPTNRSQSLLHSPTPPEVFVPSGDVTAGVRPTREYHSRHLPPLIFLRSSTVYSSNGSPVVFRTGTTYGIQRTRTICCTPRGPSRSILANSPVLNHEASTGCVPEDDSTTPSTDL
jgi:hypothetical protein